MKSYYDEAVFAKGVAEKEADSLRAALARANALAVQLEGGLAEARIDAARSAGK